MGVWSFFKTTFFVIKMMFRFPFFVFSYYFRRRKAVGLFRKELIESGVPPLEAKKLADVYPFKLGDMIKVARNFSSAR